MEVEAAGISKDVILDNKVVFFCCTGSNSGAGIIGAAFRPFLDFAKVIFEGISNDVHITVDARQHGAEGAIKGAVLKVNGPAVLGIKIKTVRPFGNASPVIEEFATVNSNGGSVTIEGMGDGISLVRSSDWNGRVEHCF